MAEDTNVKGILKGTHRIAVLGLSPKEQRISNQIARFLVGTGREIVPINPGHPEILGETSYPNLSSVIGEIDMAVVFRAPEYTKEVLEDAKEVGISRVWFQPGAYDSSIERDYSDGIEVFHDD